MASGGPVRRAERFVVLAILLVAAVIRIGYLTEVRNDPELLEPPVDGGFILYWARGLAFHDWRLPPDAGGADPEIHTSAYQRPPGYPYVLAGILKLTGGLPVAVRAVQMLAGLLTIVLAWRFGRQLFGPAVGVTWSALLATHWTLPYFEAGIDDAWLVILLSLLMMMALRWLLLAPRAATAVPVGAACAALALVRPNALAAVPVLLAWWSWVARRRGLGWRSATTVAGTALLAGAIVLAPATLRNLRVAGALVPVSANGGITMWAGTNPTARGYSTSDVPGLGAFTSPWQMQALVDRLSEEVGRPLTFTAASNLLGRRAIAWALHHPRDAAILTLRKTALFWGPSEIAHNRAPAADRAASPLLSRLPFPFPLVLAGALLGLALLVGRRRIGDEPLLPGSLEMTVAMALYVFTWFASLLPFFVTSLYRMAVIPYLLLGLAVAAVHIVRLVRLRRRTLALGWVCAVAAAWAIAAIPWLPVDPGISKRHVVRGIGWAHLGEPDRAEAELRAAVEADPESWPAHAALGAVLLDTGQLDEAERHLLLAVRLQPGVTTIRLNLGLCAARLGQWQRAAEAFHSVVLDEPGNADAWSNLGISLEQLGDRAQAADAYSHALVADPDHEDAANNLAWLLATAPEPGLRNPTRAVALAEDLATRAPSAQVLDTLAAAYAAAGRYAAAVTSAERALAAPGAEPGLAAGIAARLEGYRHGRAFVDSSAPQPTGDG